MIPEALIIIGCGGILAAIALTSWAVFAAGAAMIIAGALLA